MARIRTIKPKLFTSKSVTQWPIAVRWTFAGLFTYMDDRGRGEDDPLMVKAEVYPRDPKMTPAKVQEHIDFLVDDGTLCRYSVDSESYLHIPTWRDHQRINRPTPSKLPACPTHEGFTEDEVST